MTILHRKVVATVDDGTSEVGSDEWNDDHAVVIDGVVAGMRRGATADRYYIAGMGSNGALANGSAWVTNTQRAFPFVPARDCTVDLIIINTVAIGTSGRMGIYNDDGNCKPGTLLAESTSGAVSLAATGLKSFVFATVAQKGGTLYWMSLAVSGVPALVHLPAANSLPILGHVSTLLGTAVAGNGWQQTRTLAALAAWGTGGSAETILNTNVPAFAVRVT